MNIDRNKFVNGAKNTSYERPEDVLQRRVFQYLSVHHPHVFAFSIPNGFDKKSFFVQKLAKDTGLKEGVPDIFIAKPKFVRTGNFEEFKYAGLFIEIKTEDCIMQLKEGGRLVNKHVRRGKLSTVQKNAIATLQKLEYKVDVTYGFDEAIRAINQYLK